MALSSPGKLQNDGFSAEADITIESAILELVCSNILSYNDYLHQMVLTPLQLYLDQALVVASRVVACNSYYY